MDDWLDRLPNKNGRRYHIVGFRGVSHALDERTLRHHPLLTVCGLRVPDPERERVTLCGEATGGAHPKGCGHCLSLAEDHMPFLENGCHGDQKRWAPASRYRGPEMAQLRRMTGESNPDPEHYLIPTFRHWHYLFERL